MPDHLSPREKRLIMNLWWWLTVPTSLAFVVVLAALAEIGANVVHGNLAPIVAFFALLILPGGLPWTIVATVMRIRGSAARSRTNTVFLVIGLTLWVTVALALTADP